MIAMGQHGFAYAGDADVASNYVELSVPVEAQHVIEQCRENPLFEMIKDFALDRKVRSDIWCRMPAEQTADKPTLFGGFSYGITIPRDQVPTQYKAHGKVISLNAPIYLHLINLMTTMPITIGDFLAHPKGSTFPPESVEEAVQVLVACGVAKPMRGGQYMGNLQSLDNPRLAGSFNRALNNREVSAEVVYLASPVAGHMVEISPREALVIQALDRGGLTKSVAVLMTELERLSKDKNVAMQVFGDATPTLEIAQTMVQDVLKRSVIQWYAYGILEAA